jgi:hypothetical protein
VNEKHYGAGVLLVKPKKYLGPFTPCGKELIAFAPYVTYSVNVIEWHSWDAERPLWFGFKHFETDRHAMLTFPADYFDVVKDGREVES